MKMKQKQDFEFGALSAQLFELSQGAYEHGSPWKPAQFYSDLEEAHSRYLILENAGKISGFVSFQQVLDEVDVTNIAVARNQQGKGLGTKLLDALQDYCEKQRKTVIFLEVRASNSSAIKLYEKAGFQSSGKRKKYYNHPVEDGLLFYKKVRCL